MIHSRELRPCYKTGLRSEDRATIGFPAYSLRQVAKFPRRTCERKPKLLYFPHPRAQRGFCC